MKINISAVKRNFWLSFTGVLLLVVASHVALYGLWKSSVSYMVRVVIIMVLAVVVMALITTKTRRHELRHVKAALKCGYDADELMVVIFGRRTTDRRYGSVPVYYRKKHPDDVSSAHAAGFTLARDNFNCIGVDKKRYIAVAGFYFNCIDGLVIFNCLAIAVESAVSLHLSYTLTTLVTICVVMAVAYVATVFESLLQSDFDIWCDGRGENEHLLHMLAWIPKGRREKKMERVQTKKAKSQVYKERMDKLESDGQFKYICELYNFNR